MCGFSSIPSSENLFLKVYRFIGFCWFLDTLTDLLTMEAYTMKLQNESSGAKPDSSEGASDAPVSEAHQLPERLTRPSVPALDAILGQPFRVLDNGFVRLLDYMGDDATVVQAVRD